MKLIIRGHFHLLSMLVLIMLSGSLQSAPALNNGSSYRATVGGAVSFYGRELGTSAAGFKIYWGTRMRPGFSRQIRADAISRWSSRSFRIRLPVGMGTAGDYWFRVWKGSTLVGEATVTLRLRKPVISFYNPGNPCPGDVLTIRGSGFSRDKNNYVVIVQTRNPNRSPSFRGYRPRSSNIRLWSPTQIKVHLPRSGSVYLKPGYNFRVQLLKKNGARIGPVAVTGPIRRFRLNCLAASDLQTGARGAIAAHSATLRILTLKPQVTLGNAVMFTGTVTANNAVSAREFRRKPMKIELRIQQKLLRPDGRYYASKYIELRGNRTSFVIYGTPRKTGHYFLQARGRRYPHINYGAASYTLNHPTSRTKLVKVVNVSVRQQYRLEYRAGAPMRTVRLGRPIFYGGTFVTTDRAFLARARAVHGAKIQWKVKRVGSGAVVGQGIITIRNLRNPFFTRVQPRRAGLYYIEFSSVPSSFRFRLTTPDLKRQAVKMLSR